MNYNEMAKIAKEVSKKVRYENSSMNMGKELMRKHNTSSIEAAYMMETKFQTIKIINAAA